MDKMITTKWLYLLIFSLFISIESYSQGSWTNPIVKQGRLGSPLVEISPFVFKNKLYLLENNQRFWDLPGGKPGDSFHEDSVHIRDVESGKIVSSALANHGFGTVLVWNDSVYVFAGDYGQNKPWRQITSITMTSSADLKNWTQPQTVLKAGSNEFFFNTAVCRARDKFVLLYETNDPAWIPFTFRYCESTDLKNWKPIPNAVYGKDKYVGGPALYYEGGWYYTLYLEALKPGYETRITRSGNLVDWMDAPTGRTFLKFDSSHKNIPLLQPPVRESNASDAELCYYKGNTIIYFTGSDQTTAGDLQWATYKGSPRQLFEHFFIGSGNKR
jgi:alpha-L-fucosidase